MQRRELDDIGHHRPEGLLEERGPPTGLVPPGPRPGQLVAIEPPRGPGNQPVRFEAALVVGLAGMVDLESTGHLVPRPGGRRRQQGLVELGGGDRPRDHLVGPDIVTLSHHDQMVLGGQYRLEQRLAHLAPRVPVTEQRHQGREVIAGRALGAEGGLVHAEEADHPEGHPAERRQRGHGHPTPEEVGPTDLVIEALVQQLPHVAELQRHRRGLAHQHGRLDHLTQDPLQGFDLPPLVALGGEEHRAGPADPIDPFGQRAGRGGLGGQVGQAAHDRGQVAYGLDILSLHPVRGDVADGQSEVLVEDGGADEQAVHRGGPGVGHHRAGKSQPLPLGRVEAPPHAGGLHPLPDHAEFVVVEPESLPHRYEGQELQHRVGVEPTGHQLEQGRGRTQHRVGGPDRAVGQAVAQRGSTGSLDLESRGRRHRVLMKSSWPGPTDRRPPRSEGRSGRGPDRAPRCRPR